MEGRTQAFELVDYLWLPDPDRSDGPRRAREPARISAYVPAPLSDRTVNLSPETAQAVVDAQDAAADVQRFAESVGIETVAHQLLRSEAIASSRMEGVEVPSHRALAKLAAGGGERPSARAGLANIDAARWVYAWAAEPGARFTVDTIEEVHRRLAAADNQLAAQAGQVRDRQNWIGHDPHTPAHADFVPPLPDRVRPLLEELCDYLNRSDEPVLVQAAMAHAQFETIHPFGDGNGRVGRALIGATLVRRGLVAEVIPPVSLVLARRSRAYIDALTSWRFDVDGPQRWILALARAVEDAALASRGLAARVRELGDRWREQAGRPRAGSAADALLDALPANPILDAARAADIAGVSTVAARSALNALAETGVLEQITVGKRNRQWECTGLFALVDDMERELSAGLRGPAATRD